MSTPRPARAGALSLPAPDAPFFLIAGPCVIESQAHALDAAHAIAEIARAHALPFVFKSSYDKANRTSGRSFRGPGLESGLKVLDEVRRKLGAPVLTDVHLPEEARDGAAVVALEQGPALLCRQTDLPLACANTGKGDNVKEEQVFSPADSGGS